MIGEPVYKRIYNDLLEKINSGSLKAGERLPSEMELCRIYNVSRITGKRALELLAGQGYISRSPGKGSFVNVIHRHPAGKDSLSSPSIGFIIPDFSDSFGTRLLYGVEESCASLGYQLILKRTRDRAAEEEAAIKSLSGAAGILLLPIHGEFYNPEILKLIVNRQPLVFVDRRLQGLEAPVVTSNNLEAAEAGAEYLLGLGHRNIAFFSGSLMYTSTVEDSHRDKSSIKGFLTLMHTSTVEDRHQGFVNALAKFGISHNPSYLCEDFSSRWTWPFNSPGRFAADIEIASKLLKAYPEISAAFASEYSMAVIVKAAAESLGRKIPEDFSILTFDSPLPVTGIPPITHLCQDEYTMGKEAVQTLHRIVTENDPVPATDIVVPAKLITGASTGPFAGFPK